MTREHIKVFRVRTVVAVAAQIPTTIVSELVPIWHMLPSHKARRAQPIVRVDSRPSQVETNVKKL